MAHRFERYSTLVVGQGPPYSLSWKCKNPPGSTGTRYELQRSINGGTFEYVGSVGEKSFVDADLPAASATVLYQVQAVRSTKAGLPAKFVLQLGTGGAATMRIREVSGAPTTARKAA